MSKYSFKSSRPDSWISPRPTRDPARARQIHGPIYPMEQQKKGLLSWLKKLIAA